jgi:hypothetical protein
MGVQQPYKQKRSGKQRIYTIASATWTTTSWIWTAIIIAFVIQFIPNYLFSDSSRTWETVLNWFNNANMAFPWNALRIFAIFAIPLLTGITILAWMLKRSLREEPEGLDKLIEVLEHDLITPQLEVLQRQFRQLLQTQATSIDVLSWLGDLLQHMPTTTDLKNLQISAHQRELTWNKKLNQALQDIHTRTTEQVEWLGDLFQQSQHTEKTISADLRTITSILEQLQNEVEIGSLPEEPTNDTASEQPVSEAESNQFATTEPFEVVAAPLLLNQLKPSSAELIEPSTSELLEESEPGLAAQDEN